MANVETVIVQTFDFWGGVGEPTICVAAPAVLNAANEVAVAAFLSGKLAFTRIAVQVEQVLSRFSPKPPTSLAEVIAVDAEARAIAAQMLELT